MGLDVDNCITSKTYIGFFNFFNSFLNNYSVKIILKILILSNFEDPKLITIEIGFGALIFWVCNLTCLLFSSFFYPFFQIFLSLRLHFPINGEKFDMQATME